MDAVDLEGYLRQGLSLDRIGELTGRHASTVGYWMKRHGLAAVNRDRHAPKGGIDKETLAALVDRGFTTREVAERLGLSQSTVRHRSGCASSAATQGDPRFRGGRPVQRLRIRQVHRSAAISPPRFRDEKIRRW